MNEPDLTSWHVIPGASNYEFNGIGEVRNKRTGKPIKHVYNKKGYAYAYVPHDNGKKHLRLIHRLLLEQFVGPPQEGEQSRHLNGDPSDNRLSNIRWGTPKQNADDKRRHRTMCVGSKIGTAKLNADAVRYIRSSGLSSKYLASLYGVHQVTINAARRGLYWSHVS